jgi:hypothetical protein
MALDQSVVGTRVKINIPGKMQDFSAVKPGDLFCYFAEGSQHWGMLTRTEAGEVAPISFTEPIQRGTATPCVHELSRFINRSVLVVGEAEVRAIWPQAFREGSPRPFDGIGELIVAEKSTMVRVKGSNGCWDIAVTNGHVQTAKVHPGSLTIPKWEIGFVQDGVFKQILQFPRTLTQEAPIPSRAR